MKTDTRPHLNKDFFIGKEVEKTKFFGLMTLFLANPEVPAERVLGVAKELKIKHVFLNAKKNYAPLGSPQLVETINLLIENNIKVTVEIPMEGFYDMPKHKNVCVLIPVPVDADFYIKLDENHGEGKGVYTANVQDLKQKKNLTKWDAYDKDSNIK